MADLAPDIQGLRSVAVLLVLLFHLWPSLVPGGFVGVDLFFVISGYLIFGILLRSMASEGGIAVIPFLAARVRRIVPAVAVVLLAIGLASPLFPPTEWRPVAEELPASAFFYENWFLAAHAVDYWGRDDNPSILQHFWSLGVEFQFYLAAPLLLIGVAWTARRIRLPVASAVAWFLLAVALLSFAVGLIEAAADPRRAYFATEARAWEFAIGGLIAALGLRTRWRHQGWLNIASLAGVAMIGAAVLALRSESLSPGLALLACAGAGVLVASGERTAVGRVLSAKPVVWLGGISYGIYLWHWPVMVVWPGDIADGYAALDGALIIAVSIGLAAATRWLVEDRVRFSPRLRRRPVLSLALGLALSAAAAAVAFVPDRLAADMEAESERIADRTLYPGALALTQGAAVPVAEPLPALSRSGRDWPEPYRSGCQADIGDATLRTCDYGDPDGVVHVVLVGDSHATQLAAPIIAAAERNGWRYTHMTMGACAFMDAQVWRDGRPYRDCSDWNEAAVAELTRLGPDFVIVTQSRTYDLPEVAAADYAGFVRDALLRRWRQLLDMGIGVIAIRDTPSMPMSSADCLVTHDPACSRPRSAFLPGSDPIVLAAQLEPRVALVDLTDAICGPITCEPVVGNVLVWLDNNHLTDSYARTMAGYVGQALEAAMGGAADDR